MFHNLTSHYNAYWNGNESFKEGVLELEKKVFDNYNVILPVYNYGKKTVAQSLNPYMDKAIEKASMVIQRHSMKFGGREYVRWIDDCYMLIGKSYFYKQELVSARRTFNFVDSEYPDNDVRFSAQVWLAKTYNQMEQFEKAEPLLKGLQEKADNGEIPYRIRKEIPLVLANTYILQENYEKAINPLYEGISLNTERDLVTRLKFILGQILQMNGDLDDASKQYLEVIKRNPPYEMAFQAKINLARSYDAQTGSSDQIVKTLKKMLKDSKNKEFLDQVYFALAEVAFKDQQDTLGINYLRLSVATSTKNPFQKTMSSLQLGDIYFEDSDYENAGAYYDTAMQSIPEDYPEIEIIKERADVLAELVDNLITVQLEDSLQYLAGLSEEARFDIIDNIIAEVIAEEQKQQEDELFRQQNMFDQQQGGFDAGNTQGAWYFYNMGTKSQGFNDFKQKWGNRKLEDLWRLSNKTVFSFEEQGEDLLAAGDSVPGDSTVMRSMDPKSRDYYLQNIPLTEDKMQASNAKLIDAFFNLGSLYREGLNDYPRSVESYLTLLQRFPDNKYLLESYYNLYKIYETLGDVENMNFYKNLILTNYPESDFAKVIENPNYFKELAEKQNEAAKLYEKTYNAFKDGQYFLVINYGDLAMTTYSDTNLLPKFEYLRALSLGKIEVVDTLAAALQQLVSNYPSSEVTPLAMNILKNIRGELQREEAEVEEVLVSPYEYNPEDPHFFVVIARRDSVNVSALKVRLSDFDKNYFSLRKLNINSILLDPKRQMVTVGNFVNASDAINYLEVIANDEYVFGNIRRINYQIFVVSTSNYPIFYNDKDVSVYLKFFDKYYKRK